MKKSKSSMGYYCKTCKYALPDLLVRGHTVNRRKYGDCLKYKEKPMEVLVLGDKCKEYENERGTCNG